MDVHGKNPDLNVNKVDSKPSTSVSFMNKVKSAAMAPIKHLKNEIQHQVANFNDQKLITRGSTALTAQLTSFSWADENAKIGMEKVSHHTKMI